MNKQPKQSARQTNGEQAPAARAKHKSGRRPASREQGRRRANGKQAAQAGRKSGRRRVGRKTTPQKADTRLQQASRTAARAAAGNSRRNTGRKSQQARQRQASKKRPARANGAARRAQKNPSEQAKFAFALLPARRGHVNRGRQKFASLFLAGTVFFCCALLFSAHCAARGAAQKGAPPPFIPCKLFEKSLTKNFTVLAV